MRIKDNPIIRSADAEDLIPHHAKELNLEEKPLYNFGYIS
jgi:hypothetical protein